MIPRCAHTSAHAHARESLACAYGVQVHALRSLALKDARARTHVRTYARTHTLAHSHTLAHLHAQEMRRKKLEKQERKRLQAQREEANRRKRAREQV